MPVSGLTHKKFGRERDQRRALMRSLMVALIENESIETTLDKAKALRPYAEKLITKAKRGDLHARRQLISTLQSADVVHHLVDDIAPLIKKRAGGYLRIERTGIRRGDGVQMAIIEFVDDLSAPEPAPKKPEAKKATKEKTETDDKKSTKTEKEAA